MNHNIKDTILNNLKEVSLLRKIPQEDLLKLNVLFFKNETELNNWINDYPNYKGLLEFKDEYLFYNHPLIVNFLDRKQTQIIMVIFYNQQKKVKYINKSSKKYNPYFKNSKILGLNLLDYDKDSLIIVEGVFDYIQLKRLGFNVISVLGSELSDYHKLICERFKKIFICFDNDTTGIKSSNNILKHIDNSFKVNLPYIDNYQLKDIDDLIKYYITEMNITDKEKLHNEINYLFKI